MFNIPWQCSALMNCDETTITDAQFAEACILYEQAVAEGAAPEHPHDPFTPMEQYFRGQVDMDLFNSVVSWWPQQVPKNISCVNLYALMTLRQREPSFAKVVEDYGNRAIDWCNANKVDPVNPNETKEERAARLNRLRVKKHRELNAAPEAIDHSDPELAALQIAEQQARENLSQGRAWFKGIQQASIAERDATIAAAKSKHSTALAHGQAFVEQAATQHALSKAALDAFRSTKQ